MKIFSRKFMQNFAKLYVTVYLKTLIDGLILHSTPKYSFKDLFFLLNKNEKIIDSCNMRNTIYSI